MLSRLDPGLCRVVQARVDVESSGLGLKSSRSGWVDVKSSGPGPVWSRQGLGRCRAERVEPMFR